ncbi:MAG TPA: helix-turn-helix domain-containing protein [Pseudonocardiaceae bacterium]|jgi:AcrR family transcriptional regulator|nr:helix-turn-helix domain-containing protein [Pseudonocardiaceae bacterium]
MTADAETPLRADARRNRDQIIAAARSIFAEHGPEIPMEEIARTAGVGVGTLYRRFPDRDSLIRAVAVDSFQRFLDDAKAAVDAEPTAWQALVRLLHQSAELQLTVQLAMLSRRSLAILKEDPAIFALRGALLTEVEHLVRRAQQEGMLRADVGTGDIAQLFAFRMRSPRGRTPEFSQLAADRCLGIMIDGLKARPGTTLPGRPLTKDDLDV